jgi:hypothetical protein
MTVLPDGVRVPVVSAASWSPWRILLWTFASSGRAGLSELCRLASLVRAVRSPRRAQAVPSEEQPIEDLYRSWSARRLGEFMYTASRADLLPGFDRATVLQTLATALRAKTSAGREQDCEFSACC